MLDCLDKLCQEKLIKTGQVNASWGHVMLLKMVYVSMSCSVCEPRCSHTDSHDLFRVLVKMRCSRQPANKAKQMGHKCANNEMNY